MTVIETRNEAEGGRTIRFSNWARYEDRVTGNLILFMTGCPGNVGRHETCGVPPHNYRYEIEFQSEGFNTRFIFRRENYRVPLFFLGIIYPAEMPGFGGYVPFEVGGMFEVGCSMCKSATLPTSDPLRPQEQTDSGIFTCSPLPADGERNKESETLLVY